MHVSVMTEEVMALLAVRRGGRYIDGTLGAAGHAAAILAAAGPEGALLAIDHDSAALERAAGRLAAVPGKVTLCQGDHGDIAAIAQKHDFKGVDGILLDLGVSSDQLDMPERGFSFQADGPLDMRFDNSRGTTAADLVATLDEQLLTYIFKNLGDEPHAIRVARAIVRARKKQPIITTMRLAEVVSNALGGRHGGRHPATRIFQALRMEVNGELKSLARALDVGPKLLAPDGRMVVITFESLSDRMVKQCFSDHAGREVSLQQGGSIWEGTPPQVESLTRRPLQASAVEIARNPRARSAKVRAVRRMRPEEEKF